jgi:hypothetical protein
MKNITLDSVLSPNYTIYNNQSKLTFSVILRVASPFVYFNCECTLYAFVLVL